MDEKLLPTFDELPSFHQYTGCAWGVWGEGDELGTVNLLTEKVVAEAVKEVKYVDHIIRLSTDLTLASRQGKMICLNL